MPLADADKQETAQWSAYKAFQEATFGVLLKLAGKLPPGAPSRLAGNPTEFPGKLAVVLVEFSGKVAC